MTPLAWLIGFVLPACGSPGAKGLPVPHLLDMSHIERPNSPNSALAAPAGTQPPPDIVTPTYDVPASQLYAAVVITAAAQERTFLAAEYPEQRQVHFVARSAVLNFPDLVAAQIGDTAPGHSTLVLYSRSVYGYSDFGVNRQRVIAWLAALQSNINRPAER